VNRAFTLDEWRAVRARTLPAIVVLAQRPRVRRKPRTAEEREMLLRAATAAVRRREAERRLVRTGPRSFELRVRRSAAGDGIAARR